MKTVNRSLPLAVSSPPESHCNGDGLATPRRGDEAAKRAYYPNLDWLRLFLALSVIVYHAWNATGPKFYGLFYAVPAFLAISGFVIIESFIRSRNWGHFAWKRVLRIAPAFVGSLLLMGLAAGKDGVTDSIGSWLSFGFASPKGNGVLWSLSCEELFYAVVPILFAVGAFKSPRFTIWALALSIAVSIPLLSAGLTPPVFTVAVLPSCFLLGILGYHYRVQLLRTRPWLPSLMLALSALAFAIRTNDLGVQELHCLVFTFSLLWFGIAGPQVRLLMPDVSYGLYVYCTPATMLAASALRASPQILGRTEWICFSLLASTLVALVSRYVIEEPALRLKNVRLLIQRFATA